MISSSNSDLNIDNTNTNTNNGKISPIMTEKRSVAKKACLSCREKKIKCDGELLISYPDNPNNKKTTYKTCSNCKSAGLECIFVPSKRGGRRKRKNNKLSSSGLRTESSSIVSLSNSNIIMDCNTNNNNSNNNNSNTPQNIPPQKFYPQSFSQNRLDKQQQQQPPPLPPWLPYELQIYPDRYQAYQQIYQMQYNSQILPQYLTDNNNNNNNNNNNISRSNQFNNNFALSMQKNDSIISESNDNKSQISQTSNLPENIKHFNQQKITTNGNNIVNNHFMHQYQYPYYYQELSQQEQEQDQEQEQEQQQQQIYQTQHNKAQNIYIHNNNDNNNNNNNNNNNIQLNNINSMQQNHLPPHITQIPIHLQHQYQYSYQPHLSQQSQITPTSQISSQQQQQKQQQQQQQHPLTYYQPPLPPPYIIPQIQPYVNYPEIQYHNNMNMNMSMNMNMNKNYITPQRKMKFVDFEDKNSSHYLKKKTINKESNSIISSATGTSSESSNQEEIQDIQNKEDNIVKIQNNNNNNKNDNKDNNKVKEIINHNDTNNDNDRDNDSWSISLAPSDSVTMIQSKRMRQEMKKYENKFQVINENEIKFNNNNNNNNNINNKESSSKLRSNSDSKNNSSNTESGHDSSSVNHNNISSNPTSNSNTHNNSKKIEPISTSSITDISTTEKWIDEQNNALKRTAIANEQELKELYKRQKKYEPLKLNIKFPIFINQQLLENAKLPDMQTIYKLVGVYYKYVNPHTLILPNMTFFIDNLSISNDTICLLASMFKISARYMSHNEINNIWLAESYWEDLFNNLKDKISIKFSIICSIIQCSRGDDNYINECIKLINLNNLDQSLINLSWNNLEKLKESVSSVVLLEREILIRVYWFVFKVQNFRRLTFGYPYNKGENDEFLKLNKNVELPLPDTKYYKQTEKLHDFKKLYNKNLTLSSISTTYPDGSKLYDSACSIVSLILLEEIMESISNKTLFSNTILRFSHRLNKNFQIHENFKHLQPYQLETHPKKEPHIIINASNFSSTFINRLTCLILSIGICNKILVYSPKSTKPIRSQINPFNDLSLVQIDPKLIIEISNKILNPDEKLQNWTWFFKAIDIISDLLLLLELGDGVCSATLSDAKPIDEIFETVIGPCCAGSCVVEEWCKYNTWTMNVSNVPVENQGWIQMSGITVWGMVQAWSFLSSLVLYLEVLDIVLDEESKNDDIKEEYTNQTEEEKIKENEDIVLSDNEDEERKQVTGDAGRIDSEADFKRRVKRESFNVGGTCNIENFKEFKDKKIRIVVKETNEILVSGIEFNSAPNIFFMLLQEKIQDKNERVNQVKHKIIEKMKVIRKYLGIMEKYSGDCKIAGVYCDKTLDYIFSLTDKNC